MPLPKDIELVICCGMSRSGSTLQYQLVKMILEDIGWGEGIGFPNKWAEFNRGKAIVKAERYTPWLGEMLDSGRALGLSMHRDPRQVAISLHHFYTERARSTTRGLLPTWEEVLHRWLPRAIEWHDAWTEHGAGSWPYEVYYNRAGALTLVLASALNIDISDTNFARIDAAFGVGSQLIRIKALNKWIDNTDTLLTQGHISPSLGAETWQDRLSLNQIRDVQYVAKEWMERWGYNPVDFIIDPSMPYHWDTVPGEVRQDKEIWNG